MHGDQVQPQQAHSKFSDVLDPAIYEPLPDDWLIAITDVVDSTSATRSGRYEDVNFAGASAIAAFGNAWGTFDFPFVFRGDGAAFALPPEAAATATSALRQVAAFAKRSLGLALRTGLLSVRDVRANGRDVTIARYAASQDATYTMFAGGGLKWAENEIKRGRYLVKPHMDTAQPNLTGLRCEWKPFASQRGEILSLLVEPAAQTGAQGFVSLARRVLSILEAGPRQSNPVPDAIGVPKDEHTQVDPKRWSTVAAGSDFRKYDDGLRLTLDCTREQIDRVETLLVAARHRGEVNFGLHRQSHALMTCLVPSAKPDSHLHFLDGMDGGYSKAAEMLAPAGLAAA